MLDQARILILGGKGMVGRALHAQLPNATALGSRDYDLTQVACVQAMYRKYRPDYVFHLAALVGGVKANMAQGADFYYQNTMINAHVLHYAHVFGVKKVLSLLSTCVYPDQINYPLQECAIHDGAPHASNYPYAYAKRMLDVQSRAYRDQYGCRFITAIPNNLFGEHDQFHLHNSHVIPAIIHKTWLACQDKTPLTLWGNGSAIREFTYAPDLARALVFLMMHYEESTPINVGNTQAYSIYEIAQKIAGCLDYHGEVLWDHDQPQGQHQKPSCQEKMAKLGWLQSQYTPIDQALLKVCQWFLQHYPHVRGGILDAGLTAATQQSADSAAG